MAEQTVEQKTIRELVESRRRPDSPEARYARVTEALEPLLRESNRLREQLADAQDRLREYNAFAFKARKYIHDNLHRRGVPMAHCALCEALDGEL